jgi:hypothetical protein
MAALAKNILFNSAMMRVLLTDGRAINVPLEWFPRLRNAKKKQLENFRLIGGGIGIHWEALDEDISVAGFYWRAE